MTSILMIAALLMPGQTEANTAPTSDVERAEETVRLARAEALRYELGQSDAPDEKFKLRSEPILKWSNPSEGALFGSVLLWTTNGRPSVVGSIYHWFEERTEFQSELKLLAPHSIELTREGAPFWRAETSDIEFRELSDVASPASSKSRRLQQMREIARRFTATVTHPNKGSTSLRLLSQPVYRYEELPDDLIDGAMFAFVQGTDPEVFLMIEAKKTAHGYVWTYAVVRMNMFELSVAMDDMEVWRAEEMKWTDVISRSGPYMIYLIHK